MGVPTIRLDRLDLVLLSSACLGALCSAQREQAAALIGGVVPAWWPDERDMGLLRRRLDQVNRDQQTGDWLLRGLVLRDTNELVGHVGFHGPPGVNGLGNEDAVEIGYTVFPAFRAKGYATEAAAGLIRWARDERGIRTVIASVSPDNTASLAIVRKIGFEHVGQQWDEEDGLELVFTATAGRDAVHTT